MEGAFVDEVFGVWGRPQADREVCGRHQVEPSVCLL